jgi:hypothetical protein
MVINWGDGMLKEFKRVCKYIIKGEFVEDVLNGYSQRLERESLVREVKQDLRNIIKTKHGDREVIDEVFRLPQKKFKIFIEEFPEIYKDMVEYRRKYVFFK